MAGPPDRNAFAQDGELIVGDFAADPTASVRIVQQLPAALAQLGAASVQEVIGTLKDEKKPI